MKPEEQMRFIADLLDLINALQELIIDHCRTLADERERHVPEHSSEYEDTPF